MELLLPVLLVVCLGSGAAILTALEILVSHLRQHRARVIAREKPQLAESIRLLAENREPLLGILVTAGAILTLGAVVLAFYLISEYAIPAGYPPLLTMVLTIATALVLGDLLPKILALSIPTTLLSLVARPLASLLPPLLATGRAIHSLGNEIASFFVPPSRFPDAPVVATELETLVDMRTETGVLSGEEGEIIREILKIGQKTAKDCMTPRVDAAFLDADLDPAEVPAALRAIGHRFVPLFRGDQDGVFGILNVRRFFESGARDLAGATLPPVFVPENANALQLFEHQLADTEALAVVLDEYGNVEGVVTHTDVIEDLLEDAATPSGTQPTIHAVGLDRYLITGSARVDEFEETIGMDLEAEGIDTLGGLLFSRIGHIPARNSTHSFGDLTFTVRKIRRNRIEELLVEVATEAGRARREERLP